MVDKYLRRITLPPAYYLVIYPTTTSFWIVVGYGYWYPFLIIYRIKSLTKYLSQQRRLRRTPFHAPISPLLHITRQTKRKKQYFSADIEYHVSLQSKCPYRIWYLPICPFSSTTGCVINRVVRVSLLLNN